MEESEVIILIIVAFEYYNTKFISILTKPDLSGSREPVLILA